ncbi:methyltransferase domain-containing protein [Azospirillum sp. RWY-5-1]|uniref:Methyltransferase domain-containing protein n=1 Tax=Azospirillum oleiclasticum TaxID=2735135 RepID=A0ABX2TMY0_9PROT|nr:class I SAM-dependent methyltransferase [Azospirillum oleiclasticum]NYZ17599.1 methyltransferase domain-containing protein [Azospirillum oleiclasticum]NYZ24933.1 methyltransferase domain-containing protein [Azospirillum oleiclasticum]
MSDWSAGYVSDIEYLPGFYREQGPAHLHLTCLINGIEPPDQSQGFDYCELGCGTGVTVSLLAAANPKGRFHAIDFHPAHIARARAFAASAGLDNITFHEASFEEMAAGAGPALPQFDFVTLHGVYSWVSAENRRAITRFLRTAVKPGGLVYVSYNAQPGWTAMMPLQRLLYEFGNLVHDRSDRQVSAALDFAEKLQKAGARVVGEEGIVQKLRGENKAQGGEDQLVYLAHEYLNGSWQPLYHVDVAREMADAKLVFVGSGTVFENYPELALTPEQREVLATVPVPSLRETFKDYCVGRPFRRDLYVRGARRLSAHRRDELLRAMGLAMTVPPADARTTIKVPLGEAEMEKAHYLPILAALSEGPRSIGALLDLPVLRETKASLTPVEVAGMLVGSQQAVPALDLAATGDAPLPSVLRFNRVQAAEVAAAARRKMSCMATGVAGSGLHVSMMEVLLYDGLAAGLPAELEPLVNHALGRILGSGESLVRDGVTLEGAEQNRAAIADSLGWCLEHSLPVWKRLRMI